MNKKYFETENKRKRAKKIEYLETEKSIYNDDDKLFPRKKWLDFTFRIEETKYVNKILSEIFWEPIGGDDKFDDYLKMKQLRDNKAIASVIIQTWCDNYCTFCIVPFTRWWEVSRDEWEIIKEVHEAVDYWAKEITLLGQNVNSYWKQLKKWSWNQEKLMWNDGIKKSPFRELLEEVNQISWIDRIRFFSSNPHDMTKDILDAHFELDKMCNYLHFALQSWSDEILIKMNRKHSYNDFKKLVEYLRWKDPLFWISTDIITWFSWETDRMFEQTISALDEIIFDFIYIARYSVRPGTIAAKQFPDDVPQEVKAKRWHKLNEILYASIQKRNNLMLWKVEEILIEWKKDALYYWRTRNFKEVHFTGSEKITQWEIVQVKIEKLNDWNIEWTIID